MSFYVIRQDKYGRGERWVVNIGDSVVTLVQPDGQPLLEWTAEQIADGVQFPSFSKSIKYVGFNAPHMRMIQFAMDSAAVKSLRAFASRGIAARGPEAVRSVLHRAILTCIFGGALLCIGLVFFAITIYEAATGQSATHGIPHIVGLTTTLTGFAAICRGIYGFYHYSQLKALARARAGGAV